MAYDELNDKVQNSSKIKKELKGLLQSYFSGEPFFTKSALEDAKVRLEKRNTVKGPSGKDSFVVPDNSWSYMILYYSVQHVVDDIINYGSTFDLDPIHIGGTRWSIFVSKIVCFALGSLSPRSGSDGSSSRTHAIQHAAVERSISYFKERAGHDICCYAQGPAYSDTDKEFLRTIGIDVIEDPNGFLEVDENTFVVSISTDVPVNIIVPDLQPPVATLWNTPKPINLEVQRWEEILKGSNWHGGYESPRLRMLVENYVQQKLLDEGKNFGDVTLYVRKP